MPAIRALPCLRRAALAALLLSAAQAAFAQQQPQSLPRLVEEVMVTGIRRLTGGEIFRHIKTRPGEPYDPEQTQRDLQALAGLGVFDRRGLRVVTETGQRGGVVVSFEVRELPVIASVKFEGLRSGDERPLLEGLRRRRLEVDGRSVYEQDKIARAMGAIKELLRGRGWRSVEVQTRVNVVSSTSVELTFVVTGLPPKKRAEPKRLDRPARRPDAIG